ncbi:glycosyltransferase [bacterium]|nr:glycosyltransferase [bacterium]
MIDVVMSCYGGERYLPGAIESVLHQSYSHLRFIIVDDGSPGEVRDIVGRYAEQDPRILFLLKEHTGLTPSLRYGVEAGSAPWIARMDSDDIWYPEKLAEQVRMITTHDDIVLCGTGCVLINEQGERQGEYRYPERHEDLLRHLFSQKRFFPHSSAVFSRAAYEKVGGYRTPFVKSQDADLWLRLARCGRITSLPDSFLELRKHEAQISQQKRGYPQFVYSCAAVICARLRERDEEREPLHDEEHWNAFLDRVSESVQETRALAAREELAAIKTLWHEKNPRLFCRSIRFLLGGDLFRCLRWRMYGNRPFTDAFARQWTNERG